MGVNLGSLEIAGLKLGDTDVAKVYLGTQEIYSGSTSAYTYLQYLESDGVAYANAGRILGSVSRPETKITLTGIGGDASYGMFGAAGDSRAIQLNRDKNYIYIAFNGASGGSDWAIQKFTENNTRVLKIVDHSGRPQYDSGFMLDGVECPQTLGYNTGTWTVNQDCHLLGTSRPSASQPARAGDRMYYFKILEKGTGNVLYNFLPCRNANGELGFHETVNDVFYGNVAGAGAFIAGPDAN